MKSKYIWILCIVWFVAVAIGYAMWGHTLVEWYRPVVWALALAALLMPLMLRWWTRLARPVWARIAIQLAGVGGLLYCALLAVNTCTAKPERGEAVVARVDSKFTRQHQQTGRRGRMYGKRNSYHLMLAFPDGRRKEISVSTDTYVNTRVGRRYTYNMSAGILGWNVFRAPQAESEPSEAQKSEKSEAEK